MFKIKPRIEETWYIVFEEALKRKWYFKWFKPGFTHCYIMKKSEGGCFWLVVNPVWSHVIVDYRSVETFPTVRDYAGSHALVLEYKAFIDPYSKVWALGVNSCVDVVKRFLGIRRFTLFTPYQLYKYLRK